MNEQNIYAAPQTKLSREEQVNTALVSPFGALPKILTRLMISLLIMFFILFVIFIVMVVFSIVGHLNLLELEGLITALVSLYMLVYLITLVVTVVFFFMWIYRASKNANGFGVSMKYTPRWAVGWHFIPFACAFMPYLAMKEVLEVSAKDKGVGKGGLITWWASWVCGVTFYLLGNFMWSGIYIVSYGGSLFTLLSIVAFVLATIFGVIMIKRITKLQEEYSRD